MPKKSSGMQEIIYPSCISPQRISKCDHPIRFTVYKLVLPKKDVNLLTYVLLSAF